MAKGEFVYFVDNDDWLGPQALERLHSAALSNDADIVIGKVVGHGKIVPRTLFRRNRPEVTLEWPPLLRLLTPHKLFRKALLDEHRIRFPEGRRRLEDHMFVVHAYFHARRISVLADYPCYHWMLRDASTNASWRRLDPVAYFDNVREVLDLVEEHTERGPLRDRLYAHWYRGKMLGRVGGGPFVRREPRYRRELYEEIRRLALERYGPGVDEWLPFNLRVRSHLLREGSYESLRALADFESELRADVTVREVRWEDDKLALQLHTTLVGERDQLALARRGQRMLWCPPQALREELPEALPDVTEELPNSRVQILLRSTRDQTEYVLSPRMETVFLRVDREDLELKRPVFIAAADIDPKTAAAGARLSAGDWQVHVLVDVANFTATAPAVPLRRRWALRRWHKRNREPAPLTLRVTRAGRLLRPPPLRRRLARRLRRAGRLLRPARRRGRARLAG
jgi:hypothetical protein